MNNFQTTLYLVALVCCIVHLSQGAATRILLTSEAQLNLTKQIINATYTEQIYEGYYPRDCTYPDNAQNIGNYVNSDLHSCPWYYESNTKPSRHYPRSISNAVLKDCFPQFNSTKYCVDLSRVSTNSRRNRNGVCVPLTRDIAVINKESNAFYLQAETIVIGYTCKFQPTGTDKAQFGRRKRFLARKPL